MSCLQTVFITFNTHDRSGFYQFAFVMGHLLQEVQLPFAIDTLSDIRPEVYFSVELFTEDNSYV